ncbi:MAG: hypothetical protein ACOYL3_15570 [Desulfuromonadaceae bacterium]
MKIFLRDHDPESGWKESLEDVLAPFFERYDECLHVAGQHCLPDSEPAFHCQDDTLIFLHSQGTLNDWLDASECGAYRGNIIVVRSNGGATGYHGDNQRIHDCIWSPEQFVERPEPQRFISALTRGLPLPWEFLKQQKFPASAISCCWLLASGSKSSDAKECLTREWPNTLREVEQLTGSDHGLSPSVPVEDDEINAAHVRLRDLLDSTWKTWAPNAPIVAIRNNAAHSLAGRLKRGEPTHDVIESMSHELKKLSDCLESGFNPCENYLKLLEPLRSIPLHERSKLADFVRQSTVDCYVTKDVQTCVTSCLDRLNRHKNDVNEVRFIEAVQQLCQLLDTLPNRIPMP